MEGASTVVWLRGAAQAGKRIENWLKGLKKLPYREGFLEAVTGTGIPLVDGFCHPCSNLHSGLGGQDNCGTHLHLVLSKCIRMNKPFLSSLPGWRSMLWPSRAVGGQVVQHLLVTPQSPDCPRKASCALQTPHLLLFTPQPRRPVWTATSPVTMATASLSGGSVMARRSVLMAPMSLRPLAVSPALWAEGGGPHSGPQFT